MKKFNKLFVVVIILITGMLTSCVMPQPGTTVRTLSSIEVEKAENFTQGVAGEFNITTLDLELVYNDGLKEYIDITESMISSSDLGKLQTAGTHSIVISYKGFTTVFEITLVEITHENVDEYIEAAIKQTTIPSSVNDDFTLPRTVNGVEITWVSKNTTSIVIYGSNAAINQEKEDVTVTLVGTFTYKGTSKTKNYTVVVEKKTESSSTYEGTYYDDVDLTLVGDALKAVLRELLQDTRTKYTTYAECRDRGPYVDEDVNNPDNMLLFYTGESVSDVGTFNIKWNREHVWPKSLGWFNESQAGSDLHHIRPCDKSLNSSRGNKKFGTTTNSTYFCPDDSYKGDVARIIFYLMVAYNEADNYSFTRVAQSLTMLLDWNELDPVSEAEIIRNDRVEEIQGNRNPFIDYPELADQIW